jgi:hypothetical protein
MTPRQRIPCQESSAVPGLTAGGTAVNGERLHQLLHRYLTTADDKSSQFRTVVTIRSGRNSGVRIGAVELQTHAYPPHRTRTLLHTPALNRWSGQISSCWNCQRFFPLAPQSTLRTAGRLHRSTQCDPPYKNYKVKGKPAVPGHARLSSLKKLRPPGPGRHTASR